MVIPIRELQPTGEYHLPGMREPVTAYHVRLAVKRLATRDRHAIQRYIGGGGQGKLPPGPALEALRAAVEECLLSGKRTAPKGSSPLHGAK